MKKTLQLQLLAALAQTTPVVLVADPLAAVPVAVPAAVVPAAAVRVAAAPVVVAPVAAAVAVAVAAVAVAVVAVAAADNLGRLRSPSPYALPQKPLFMAVSALS